MIQVGSQDAQPAPPPSAKPTIYVVDDDAGVLGSLRFLLETDGFTVRTFRSGTAVLSAALSAGVDCFVIDYKMPDMNGIDLARRLRSPGRGSRCRSRPAQTPFGGQPGQADPGSDRGSPFRRRNGLRDST
jgi:two-component system response regulator FixJ